MPAAEFVCPSVCLLVSPVNKQLRTGWIALRRSQYKERRNAHISIATRPAGSQEVLSILQQASLAARIASSCRPCTDDKHTPRRWGSMKITRWNAESKHTRASIGCPSRSFIHRKLAFFAVRSLLSACAARARGDVHFFCNVVCVCAPTQGTRRALFKLSARPWYSRSILYNPTNETYTKKQVARDKGGTAERQ